MTINPYAPTLGIRTNQKEITISLEGLPEDSLPDFMQELPDSERVFTFLINPRELSKSYSRPVNEYFTRAGWIFEHLGDNLPTMTVSGDTAAFRDPRPINKSGFDDAAKKVQRGILQIFEDPKALAQQGGFRAAVDNGLTTRYRYASFGFRNLLHLIDVYRSNGRVLGAPSYTQDPSTRGSTFAFKQRISRVLPVKIYYDEEIYEGFFTGMGVTEDANSNPYSLAFNLDFTITKIDEIWKNRNSNQTLEAFI